jgi:hypothetical protein
MLEHGADMFRVMDVTRHRRVETLKGYDRRAKAFRNHAGEGFLGLRKTLQDKGPRHCRNSLAGSKRCWPTTAISARRM